MDNLINHLAFRAKLEPDSIAVQKLDGQITFAQLLIDVKKIANKLRHAGIQPGQVVVTALPDKELDWLVTLALFHEATISCALTEYNSPVSLFEYDWIISSVRLNEHFPPQRMILIDSRWLADAMNQSYEIEPIDYESESSPARIFLTSGTTGQSKAVALSAAQAIQRARNSLQFTSSFNRFISLFPLATALGLNNAITNLIKGNPLYCAHVDRIIELINKFSVEGVHASVVQLAGLIKESSGNNQAPKSLKMIIYAGAATSPLLLENVAKLLTGNIYNDYGSTETAGLCTFKPNAQTNPSICGYPYADVEMQVVGELHQPLPQGEEGLLRFRRPYMVDEYYKDPLSSHDFFRDGWFYPNDRGRLMKDGSLVLAGRVTEVINRGGIKIDPTVIDLFLSAYPGIVDAAAFGFMNKMGLQDIGAAIVVADGFDMKTLRRELLKRFGANIAPSTLFRVDQIPRNKMGKVMRKLMSTKIVEMMG